MYYNVIHSKMEYVGDQSQSWISWLGQSQSWIGWLDQSQSWISRLEQLPQLQRAGLVDLINHIAGFDQSYSWIRSKQHPYAGTAQRQCIVTKYYYITFVSLTTNSYSSIKIRYKTNLLPSTQYPACEQSQQTTSTFIVIFFLLWKNHV